MDLIRHTLPQSIAIAVCWKGILATRRKVGEDLVQGVPREFEWERMMMMKKKKSERSVWSR
eukprot:scaffold10222_cov140-Skeletonema_menzelii.AAC.5